MRECTLIHSDLDFENILHSSHQLQNCYRLVNQSHQVVRMPAFSRTSQKSIYCDFSRCNELVGRMLQEMDIVEYVLCGNKHETVGCQIWMKAGKANRSKTSSQYRSLTTKQLILRDKQIKRRIIANEKHTNLHILNQDKRTQCKLQGDFCTTEDQETPDFELMKSTK